MKKKNWTEFKIGDRVYVDMGIENVDPGDDPKFYGRVAELQIEGRPYGCFVQFDNHAVGELIYYDFEECDLQLCLEDSEFMDMFRTLPDQRSGERMIKP